MNALRQRIDSVKKALDINHLYYCSKTKSLISQAVAEHKIKVYLESNRVKLVNDRGGLQDH